MTEIIIGIHLKNVGIFNQRFDILLRSGLFYIYNLYIGEKMIYYKIGIEKINGIKEYHDADNVGSANNLTAWIYTNLKKRGLTFADLEDKKVYVDKHHSFGKDRVIYLKVTKAKYGMFKISVRGKYEGSKSWVFDPKTNLRTEWGNSHHDDWIYEDKLKELEDKVARSGLRS